MSPALSARGNVGVLFYRSLYNDHPKPIKTCVNEVLELLRDVLEMPLEVLDLALVRDPVLGEF